MFFRPLLGFLVKTLHVLLQLLAVHPPHPAAADLDGGQLIGDRCVDGRQ